LFKDRKIGVVVPARDEGLLIGRTILSIPDFVDRICVVDDGSLDHTASVVRQLARHDARISLHHHTSAEGVGAAILKGYELMHGDGIEVIAVMAGDAQMDPRDLGPLLAPICSSEAEYVKGDRFSHPHLWRSMPKDRLFGNTVLTWVTRGVSGYRELKDAQCGYTAIDARLVPELLLAPVERGYGFPNSLLAFLGGVGARLSQVCVRPIYGEESSGLKMGLVLRRYPRVLWNSWRMRLSIQEEHRSFEDSDHEAEEPKLPMGQLSRR
jgi:glycosyltransferase involved in cell wall biosynthesis